MYKQAIPMAKRNAPPSSYIGKPYFRLTPKMLYLSNELMKLLPESTESVSIAVDREGRKMIVSPGGCFRLHAVKETQRARRIETSGALSAITQAGFPLGLLGMYLPAEKLMDGAVAVSLIPNFKPMEE